MADTCTAQDDSWASRCGGGEVKVGWDKDNCNGRSYTGKSICCPASEPVAHRRCSWRGGEENANCNGQCSEGEVQLWASKWGGGGNVNKCYRGTKALCCEADFQGQYCGSLNPYSYLCCPKPAALTDCQYRGTAAFDCRDAQCRDDEVAVDFSPNGDSAYQCPYSKQKVGCCKINIPKPPRSETACPEYDWCEAFPYECALEQDDAMGSDRHGVLEPRGGDPRTFPSSNGINGIDSRRYRPRSDFIQWGLRRTAQLPFYIVSEICERTDVLKKVASVLAQFPKALDVEHPIDLQVVMRFIESCVTGLLPGGGRSVLLKITADYFNTYFTGSWELPANLPLVSPTSPDLRSCVARIFEALGSITNMAPFFLADSETNQIKGSFIGLQEPMKLAKLKRLVVDSLAGGSGAAAAERKWMSYVRKSIPVFKYLQDPEVSASFAAVAANIRAQLVIIETYTSVFGGTGLVHHWDEYWAALMVAVPRFARQTVTDYIHAAIAVYNERQPADYVAKMQIFNAWIQSGN
ncbi:hypothetical protein B0T19DRAFT_457475 [Cercophora scortea]|uniref:Uncharacterized protein n=1 Tax=Cercophora scortea TaxID=314031 RepID=A0AAE0IXZ4_9PEZI|nr:hypothetical protein B0T19DRAFT_457475 [Cercophora scortea]